jgi:hypothetical protein
MDLTEGRKFPDAGRACSNSLCLCGQSHSPTAAIGSQQSLRRRLVGRRSRNSAFLSVMPDDRRQSATAGSSVSGQCADASRRRLARREDPAIAIRTDRAVDHLAAARRQELHTLAALLVAVGMVLISNRSFGDFHCGGSLGRIVGESSHRTDRCCRGTSQQAAPREHGADRFFGS